MTRHSTQYYRRYWILLVLRAAKLSGSATVPSDLFHRLVYFVNALLPAVGLKAETARVLKASYGPFFPEYQWDLDRLIGNGLISAVDLSWISEDQRFFGKYRITDRGIKLSEKISLNSPFLSDVESAISEIVSAFISSPRALSTLAAHLDANLGQDTIREGQVIDFGEWQTENFSQNAAEFLFESWLSNLVKGGLERRDLPRIIPPLVGTDATDESNYLTEISSNELVSESPSIDSQPSVPISQHKRAFHLYAHYLVQSLSRLDISLTTRI